MNSGRVSVSHLFFHYHNSVALKDIGPLQADKSAFWKAVFHCGAPGGKRFICDLGQSRGGKKEDICWNAHVVENTFYFQRIYINANAPHVPGNRNYSFSRNFNTHTNRDVVDIAVIRSIFNRLP